MGILQLACVETWVWSMLDAPHHHHDNMRWQPAWLHCTPPAATWPLLLNMHHSRCLWHAIGMLLAGSVTTNPWVQQASVLRVGTAAHTHQHAFYSIAICHLPHHPAIDIIVLITIIPGRRASMHTAQTMLAGTGYCV